MVSVALSGPQTVSNHRAQRYIWAQSERARRMHAFTNLLRRMVSGQNGEEFQDRYAFPVIEYSDKTLYMRDKDALWWLSMQHLLTKTMRQVVLGKTLTVTSPYRGAPEEAKALTSGLQEMLQNLFGPPISNGAGRGTLSEASTNGKQPDAHCSKENRVHHQTCSASPVAQDATLVLLYPPLTLRLLLHKILPGESRLAIIGLSTH